MSLSSRRFGCRRIIKKTPGLHSWSALWKMAWKNQHQEKKEGWTIALCQIRKCLHPEFNFNQFERDRQCVCLAKKSRSNNHRQNSAGAVLGVGHWARASAVAVVLSKKFFLTHISRRLTPAATSMLPTSRFKPRSRPSSSTNTNKWLSAHAKIAT